MNEKHAKKVRRMVRAQVKEEVGEGIAALQKIVRKRPRYIPKALWALLYLPLFKAKYLKFIFKYIQ